MYGKGRVLLIVHDVYQEDNEFPLGVGYLAAALKKYGADVTICCQDVYHYSNEELVEKHLKNDNYDLIGVGFLAARFKETIIDLCRTIIQNKKNAYLILGAQGASAIPEYVLKTTKADLVAIGEAEETIVEVLDAIRHNKGFNNIKGIAYRGENRVVINERRSPIKNLDTIPFPAWELFPMEIYTTNMRYHRQEENEKAFQIITSRGCVNRCTFCYRMEKGIRFRSIKNVVEEIKLLNHKYGVTYFAMSDELFVASIKRLREFVDALQKENLKIRYFCGGIRANTITGEMLKLLKDSGCCYINVGFESITQKCLDDLKKNTTVQDNIRAAELIKKYDIAIGINFIWGTWVDDEKTLQANVDFIKKYNTYDELRTIRPITPYPGSEMYDKAIQKGLLTGPEDFFDKFSNSDLLTVNFTQLSNDSFYKVLFEANKELILDHYSQTQGNMNEAHQRINDFHNLYFKGFVKFRGARHFAKKTVSPEINKITIPKK